MSPVGYHKTLPSWDIILFIYSILVIPVLLALLVGLNLVVWAGERINYVFIFGAQNPTCLSRSYQSFSKN